MTTEHSPGSEHLLILPDERVAEQVAADLAEEGFARAQVVRQGPPTEGAGTAEWTVHVIDDRLPDRGAAYEGLRERFIALVEEHGGRYDEPGDPRPPVSPTPD